jgi:hypothetical protein
MTKRCSSCGEAKPHEEFYRLRRSADGRQGYCKPCANRKRLEWKRANRDREREWYRLGQARLTPRQKKDRDLRTKFQMGIVEYERRLQEQGGGCAVCGEPPSSDRALAVDHDHSCCPSSRKTCGECTRELLCFRCNGALGNVSDSKERLLALVDYLERHADRR